MFPNGKIEWEKSKFSENVPAWVLSPPKGERTDKWGGRQWPHFQAQAQRLIDVRSANRSIHLGSKRHFREVAVLICRHAIPAHTGSQARNFALRGLVAMMVAMELTTLLWRRPADDDHQNEGCGINMATRSATPH
jgi:alkanesulfonate monooxygenase SsuD/methylene tetrahydromethanopterin reductase-like flavin-dependent oxidoreductase (luciferase family)